MKTINTVFFLLLFAVLSFAQIPHLEVAGGIKAKGTIHSENGGIKFPDSSIQTTAAFNAINNDNQNAFSKGQPFVLITTNNPAISDTLEVVELIEGGLEFLPNSSPSANSFIVKLNLENVSQQLMAKSASYILLTKFTIYFPDPNVPNSFTKTIELRNATIRKITHSVNFTGNTHYAHLTDITVAYQQIEVRTINNGATNCFCWNFLVANTCNCD